MKGCCFGWRFWFVPLRWHTNFDDVPNPQCLVNAIGIRTYTFPVFKTPIHHYPLSAPPYCKLSRHRSRSLPSQWNGKINEFPSIHPLIVVGGTKFHKQSEFKWIRQRERQREWMDGCCSCRYSFCLTDI